MKMFATCMECQEELGRPSFEPFYLPYYDDRLAYVNCSRGHRSAAILQSPKFEVLMESGADALLADFTAEASASFSAALERCYEFAIRVVFLHRNCRQTLDKMFPKIADRSERQVGAFVALIALETGVIVSPSNKITEFRNKVIHKGLIPEPEQAHQFCSMVYSEIYSLVALLREHFFDAVQETIARDIQARMKLVDANTPVATASGSGLFNISHEVNKETFAEALSAYEKRLADFKKAMEVMGGMFRATQVGDSP